MVVAVGNVDGAVGGDAATVRPVKAGVGGRAAVAVAAAPPAGDGGHEAGGGVNAADGVVFGVHHDDIAGGVAAQGFGRAPGGVQRRAAVAGIAALRRRAGHGAHNAPGGDHAHAVAFPLGDIDIAAPVRAYGAGAQDAGLPGRHTVAAPRFLPVAGESVNQPGRQVQTADALVLNIGNEQAAASI